MIPLLAQWVREKWGRPAASRRGSTGVVVAAVRGGTRCEQNTSILGFGRDGALAFATYFLDSAPFRSAPRTGVSGLHRVGPARGSRAEPGQIHPGRSHFGSTTPIVPAFWPPPIPLFLESTYDGRSLAAKGEPAARYPRRIGPHPCRWNRLRAP